MNPARNLCPTITIALVLALVGCSDDEPAAQTETTPVSDDASTTPPAETPTDAGPTDMVDLHGPLEPGLYSMAAWGETDQTGPLPRAVLDVPEGYFSNGGYDLDAGHDGVTDDQLGQISVWHAIQVLADPCRGRTAADVGPTVDDLAQALVDQTGPSTQPRPVVLDGHRGLYPRRHRPTERRPHPLHGRELHPVPDRAQGRQRLLLNTPEWSTASGSSTSTAPASSSWPALPRRDRRTAPGADRHRGVDRLRACAQLTPGRTRTRSTIRVDRAFDVSASCCRR